MNQSWYKILALALSLPSTIIALALGLYELVNRGYLDEYVALLIFCLVIGQTLFLMVYYAHKNKSKD